MDFQPRWKLKRRTTHGSLTQINKIEIFYIFKIFPNVMGSSSIFCLFFQSTSIFFIHPFPGMWYPSSKTFFHSCSVGYDFKLFLFIIIFPHSGILIRKVKEFHLGVSLIPGPLCWRNVPFFVLWGHNVMSMMQIFLKLFLTIFPCVHWAALSVNSILLACK